MQRVIDERVGTRAARRARTIARRLGDRKAAARCSRAMPRATGERVGAARRGGREAAVSRVELLPLGRGISALFISERHPVCLSSHRRIRRAPTTCCVLKHPRLCGELYGLLAQIPARCLARHPPPACRHRRSGDLPADYTRGFIPPLATQRDTTDPDRGECSHALPTRRVCCNDSLQITDVLRARSTLKALAAAYSRSPWAIAAVSSRCCSRSRSPATASSRRRRIVRRRSGSGLADRGRWLRQLSNSSFPHNPTCPRSISSRRSTARK